MRAAPAVRLCFRHPTPLWRASLALLAALAAASAAAALSAHGGASGLPGVASIAAAAAVAAALALALPRPRVLALAWDGRCWTLGEDGRGEPHAGELTVAMDLGSALLLRFKPEQAPRRACWIALARAGQPQWHALRCAVYSPRPAAEPAVAATDGAAADTHDRP